MKTIKSLKELINYMKGKTFTATEILMINYFKAGIIKELFFKEG